MPSNPAWLNIFVRVFILPAQARGAVAAAQQRIQQASATEARERVLLAKAESQKQQAEAAASDASAARMELAQLKLEATSLISLLFFLKTSLKMPPEA